MNDIVKLVLYLLLFKGCDKSNKNKVNKNKKSYNFPFFFSISLNLSDKIYKILT